MHFRSAFELSAIHLVAVVGALSLLVSLAACSGGSEGRLVCSELREWSPPDPSREVIHPGRVTFCTNGDLPASSIRIQVLTDSSASMAGFSNHIPTLQAWASQGISHIRGPRIDIDSLRKCYFALHRGLFGCTVGLPRFEIFQAEGNTNLDQAIRTATDYDISIVFTDGVAATGSVGTPDCAGGVDASCVARALYSAITPQPGEPKSQVSGLWILPIVGMFSGPVYTEEKVDIANFDPDAAIGNVEVDTNTTGQIRQFHLGPNGNLRYSYSGPRVMLAIVIAKNEDLGRAMVEGLWAKSEFVQISRLEGLELYDGKKGLAIFPPIEIYPGYIPSLQVKSVEQEYNRDSEKLVCGTLEPRLLEDSKLMLSCGEGKNNQSRLSIKATQPQVLSGCLELVSLPAVQIDKTETSDGITVLDIYSLQNDPLGGSLAVSGGGLFKDSKDLRGRFTCDSAWPFPCQNSAHTIRFQAKTQYRSTADCLINVSCSSVAAQQLRALSTTDSSLFPNRVYGIRETIEALYQRLSSETNSQLFLELSICNKL